MIAPYRAARAATIAAALPLLVALPAPASAQYRGHFVPGMAGMNAGHQPPPGGAIALSWLTRTADAIRDEAGDTAHIADGSMIQRYETTLSWTARKRIRGARYGASLRAASVQGELLRERANDILETAGPGSLYIEPVSFGWENGWRAIRLAYGIMTPWESAPAIGGQAVTLGATFYIGRTHETQLSANSVTQFHARTRGEQPAYGDNTTLELAAGQTFEMDDQASVRVGYTWFGTWQFTGAAGASGAGYPENLTRRRYRAFGMGPETGITLHALRMNVVIRAEGEFGARSGAEGSMIVLSVVRWF